MSFLEVTTTGYVGGPVREVTTDGYVVMPLNRFTEIVTDGLVSSTNEVVCDGIVTLEAGSGRYVTWDATSLNTLSTLRITDGERLDGTDFVVGSSTVPAEFFVSTTSNIIGVAVCFDTSTIPLGQNITFVVEKNNVLATAVTVTVNDAAWTALQTVHVAPGWMNLELPSSISITPGDKINVIVANGSFHNLLVTNNATGKDGVQGRVLNAVLVTDLVPTSLDGRPIMALSRLTQSTLTEILSSDLTLCDVTAQTGTFDALYIGLGATVTLDPANDVTLTITKFLNVQGNLIAHPNPGKKHILQQGLNGGTAIYGTMSLTGENKVRWAKTLNTTTQFSTTLILDRAVDWTVGDRIYISSSDNQMGTVQRVQSVSGNVVTLQGGVGKGNSIGVLVVLMSRSVSLRGFSSSGRASLLVRGEMALTHAELRSTNGLYPDALSTVTFNDLSITDSQIYDYETTMTALRANDSLSGSNLTIARCGNGLVSEGTRSLGEVLIVGAFTNAATVKNGQLTADVLTANVESGAITMSGGTSFTGSVSNYWARSTLKVGSLLRIQGIVDSVHITSGFLKTASSQTSAFLAIESGAGLNSCEATGVTGDGPYVRSESGALYVGNAHFMESGTSFANLVVTGSTPLFIRLLDEDSTIPPTLVSGTLASGSRVSNRYKTRVPSGTWEAFLDPDFGQLLKIVTATVELARIPVSSGETVHLSCFSKGQGRFILESAVAPDVTHEVNNLTLLADDFSTTATASGVVVVSFQADATSYLDRVVRI